ncbi:uncharacterized protein LOC101864638 [Aplysia californica]|uniref:Uncharacterized protein LOC101864638 n=1 Tax=Aplysia californica TaxID=6500 RepID=A0ABM0JXP7_APLCA|nr:uncharacterized protein LOC101864638 [Aplysia californica]
MLIPPVRNLILYPWWPRIWREVSTIDIIVMTRREFPPNVTALQCVKRVPPIVERDDKRLFGDMRFLKKPAFPVTSMESAKSLKLNHPDHKLFLPAMSKEESKDLLHTYLVIAEALQKVNVEHFLEGGSMLGSLRHQGFIPWDDDLDIAINVKDWVKVREALSCIEGFHLRVQPNMHWAFRRQRYRFPYIDIFFYAEDETHIWALAYYIMRMTFVLSKKDVFPLTTGFFEGHLVPLPRYADRVARKVFEYDYCLSPDAHHRDHVELPVRKNVPCSELSYLYQSFNLKV